VGNLWTQFEWGNSGPGGAQIDRILWSEWVCGKRVTSNGEEIDAVYNFPPGWDSVPDSYPDAGQPVNYSAPPGTVADNEKCRADPREGEDDKRCRQPTTGGLSATEIATAEAVIQNMVSPGLLPPQAPGGTAAATHAPGSSAASAPSEGAHTTTDQDDLSEAGFPEGSVRPAVQAANNVASLFSKSWWMTALGAKRPLGPIPGATKLPNRWESAFQEVGRQLKYLFKVEAQAKYEPNNDFSVRVQHELAGRGSCAYDVQFHCCDRAS